MSAGQCRSLSLFFSPTAKDAVGNKNTLLGYSSRTLARTHSLKHSNLLFTSLLCVLIWTNVQIKWLYHKPEFMLLPRTRW